MLQVFNLLIAADTIIALSFISTNKLLKTRRRLSRLRQVTISSLPLLTIYYSAAMAWTG